MSLESNSSLAPFMPRRLFLTKFELRIGAPATIQDAFGLPFAGRDEVHHEVEPHYISVPLPQRLLVSPLVIALCGIPLLLVPAWFIWRRWRARAA